MKIKFKRDTAFRKQFFVPESFAHPAKMDAQLLIWIVEHYTEAGETILDPMAGSGTTMLACTLGRDVVLVELEEKFCKMMRDNWEQVKMRPQLGSTMGTCQIIQGDARQLEGLVDKIDIDARLLELEANGHFDLVEQFKKGNPDAKKFVLGWNSNGQADCIVSSPPYAESVGRDAKYYETLDTENKKRAREMYGRQDPSYSASPNNIGNLPYGEIDKCIFSPPYAEITGTTARDDTRPDRDNYNIGHFKSNKFHGDSEGQVGNLPYGQIDKIVTSPPYEGMEKADKRANDPEEIDKRAREFEKAGGNFHTPGRMRTIKRAFEGYAENTSNIGNLKAQSYLEAMLQVYQQCHSVLKPRGLMILVTKNFIRNKQVVRLDEDTIKLCEQAGFSFVERHYRKLPSQSFWRVIYHQKHPDVEQILNEDVLVFRK